MMWHFFLENKRAGPISTAISLSTTGLALLLRHKKLLILTHALTLSIIIAFAFSIAPRMSAWKTLVAHGVMGDNPTAEWIGIAEYIRKNTPRDAVVLPIQPRPNDPDHLYALRYIAARSGRTTPIINEYSDIFSLKGQNREYAQKERLQSIALAFETGAFQEAERLIQNVVPAPTHLTMPIWAWEAGDKSGFPFKELTRIRGYVITQRTAEQ